jgi:hypothetical protein
MISKEIIQLSGDSIILQDVKENLFPPAEVCDPVDGASLRDSKELHALYMGPETTWMEAMGEPKHLQKASSEI